MGDEVISSEDVDKVRGVVAGLGRAWTPMDVAQALTSIGRVASDSTVLTMVEELRRTSSGAGRLEPLLALDGVTDVLVNGPDQVYIDRGRGLELTDTTFTSPDELRSLAVRLAAGVGRRLDDGCPWVDARLADGTRVHAILDVLAKPGTCLSLRVPARHRMSLDDWVMASSMTAETAHLLEQVVVRKLAFLVTGGTGSGKTTLLERTIKDRDVVTTVIEGDQETTLDADRIEAAGATVVQVNTGSGCHLDAEMIRRSLDVLQPPQRSLLFVENVGNLVCPALFDLGERAKVVIISVTEGTDKPRKYPHMFAAADLIVVNKIDLLPYVDFDVAACASYARAINPSVTVLGLSAKTGEGLPAWYEWLSAGLQR